MALYNKTEKVQGKIIFLNGISSAGKTTLAKTLQYKLVAPYYWLSEDIFRDMTPKKFDNDNTYDVTIDTHNSTYEECADKIMELLDCPERFSAFRTLWARREK